MQKEFEIVITHSSITDKQKKDILAFDLGGYSFDPTLSLPNEPVFTRAQA